MTDSPEPSRRRPSEAVSSRYSTLARADTAAELHLRRVLYRRGRRYRVQSRIDGLPRRTVDVMFTRQKVVVLVDGCFWHGCPDHGTQPKTNEEWWRWKIQRNRDRDVDTNARLTELGWTVVRVWEHEDPEQAADRVEAALQDASAGESP